MNLPASRVHAARKGRLRKVEGGRYWVRTSDLFGVNEARYCCANRQLERRPPYLTTTECHSVDRSLPRSSNNSVEPAKSEV